MSLSEAWQNIRTHLEADAESVKARLEQDLPEVAQFLSDAAASPVTAALSAAVHLNEVPSALQLVASFIQQLDATLGEAKSAGAAQAPQPPADPPA